MSDGEIVTAAELRAQAEQSLKAAWERWNSSLPPEAARWPDAAVYVRESSPLSLIGDAPATQLDSALRLMQNGRYYVPPENVYFENVTGTELAARHQFQQLVDRALQGNIAALGAYISSRLFRNLEEAIATKRRLKLKGVKVLWLGRPDMDERDPSAWAMERQMELADEMHSRQTGWLCALSKERLSAAGIPTGPLPDGYRVAERGPTLPNGRRGRPIRWEYSEPWAAVIKEGKDRYLAGASYADLTVWCIDTAIKGLRPNGRPITAQWWRLSLLNPRYAGLQPVRRYQGYKPGKESPPRERDLPLDRMVPSRLPPLWDSATYQKLQQVSASRWRSGKWRPKYRDAFHSGILYSAECRHKLGTVQHVSHGKPALRQRCVEWLHDRSVSFRVDDSVEELDALIASLRFTDPTLLKAVEAELAVPVSVPLPPRDDVERQRRELSAAIASLTDESLSAVRGELTDRLRALSPVAEPARVPHREFAAAISDLQHWGHVWDTAPAKEKNRLLRAAGMKVFLRKVPIRPGDKRKDDRFSYIEEISVRDPYFAAALVTALGDRITIRRAAEGGPNAPEAVSEITDAEVLRTRKSLTPIPFVRLPDDLVFVAVRTRRTPSDLEPLPREWSATSAA